MKKLLKILGGALLVVVVLGVAAAVIVPVLVDPQDVKDELSAQVKKYTGRELEVPGEVELSVFPWLGASIGEVSLGNAQGFSAPVFARTEKVEVRVKLMPLLDRRIEMDTVTVHGLTLNLERDKQGVGNWEDLAAGGQAGEGKGAEAPGADAAQPALAGFAIGGVDLRDATLSYADAGTGQAYTVRNLSLKTGSLTSGKPVEVDLGFDLDSADPPLKGRVNAAAKVALDPATRVAMVSGLEVSADLKGGEALPVSEVVATLGTDLQLDAAKQTAVATGLQMTANLKASKLPVSEVAAKLGAALTVDGARQTAEVTGLQLSADLKGPDLPGGEAVATLAADLTLDGARRALALRNLVLSLLDLTARGTLDATGLDKSPAFNGTLEVAEFNPRKLLQALGQPEVKTADPTVLSRASLNATLSGGADALALKPLAVQLDDTSLKGETRVANFARPALRFALALDTIDLDRYLPPGTDAPPASPGVAAGKAGELPLDTLRGLDVAGTFSAGRVKVARLSVSDVNATFTAKDGLLRLSPISAKLYDGAYAGNIALDARKATPVVTLDEKLSGVQAGPLLQDLQGEDPLTGTANVSAKLRAAGTQPDDIKKTLNGTVSFQFLDGAVNGVNIGKMIRDARAKLRGEPVSDTDAPARTDFAELSGTAQITDGVISNQDLSGKSPLLRLEGKGTASLPQETIDYRTTATVVATSKGQGGKELGDLAGVPIPVRVSGTFAEPRYGLDVEALGQALLQSKARELVDQQKEKVTEKVQEQVQQKLGDSVGKALGDTKEGAGGVLKKLLGN